MIVESMNASDTFNLGARLAKTAAAGQIYSLDGDLGAGKTVFAQGFAAGLGIREPVSSPTFTILQEHKGGRLPLYHFDAYRINSPGEMDEIGYEDLFFGEGVCLIEWGGVIEELLPEETIRVRIRKDPGKGFNYRSIEIEHGEFI